MDKTDTYNGQQALTYMCILHVWDASLETLMCEMRAWKPSNLACWPLCGPCYFTYTHTHTHTHTHQRRDALQANLPHHSFVRSWWVWDYFWPIPCSTNWSNMRIKTAAVWCTMQVSSRLLGRVCLRCACMYVCVYLCIETQVDFLLLQLTVHMYTDLCVCIYICIYVYIYIYVYI